MIPAGIYGWSDGKGGVSHYRQLEPLRVAATHGIRVAWGTQLHDGIVTEYDTILGHTLWGERATEAWQKLAAQGCHRLIMDIDDAMWEPDWRPFKEHYTEEVLHRLYLNASVSHVLTTPSFAIADYLRENWGCRNVWVIPNTVPEYVTRMHMSGRRRPPGWRSLYQPNTIGYQGSPSHQHDWTEDINRGLLRLVREHPHWALHFWGPDTIEGWPRELVGNTPWQPDVRRYYMSLGLDIGVGPLADTPFNAAKSSLRAVEYAALGVPCVLPKLQPYTHSQAGVGEVEHGVTGFLYEPTDTEAMLHHIENLMGDDDLRERMGRTARDRAAGWTTEARIHRWVDAWNSVGGITP